MPQMRPPRQAKRAACTPRGYIACPLQRGVSNSRRRRDAEERAGAVQREYAKAGSHIVRRITQSACAERERFLGSGFFKGICARRMARELQVSPSSTTLRPRTGGRTSSRTGTCAPEQATDLGSRHSHPVLPTTGAGFAHLASQ